MTDNNRQKAIKQLNTYIWTLKNQCDSIAEINKGLILQYCRFAVLADEVSENIVKNISNIDCATLEDETKKYEKFNKIVLNLYKTLKFDQIKDELADFGNPYTKLLKEAEENGDF